MSSNKKPPEDNALPPPAQRARPARADGMTQRRRRREGNDNTATRRLALPEHKLDRENFAYRFVNDTPGRIQMLYDQDWDLVSDEDLGEGYSAARHADVAPNRVALTSRLMRKPRDYYESDHEAARKQNEFELRAAELGRTVLNGPTTTGEPGANAQDPRVYSPDVKSNKL